MWHDNNSTTLPESYYPGTVHLTANKWHVDFKYNLEFKIAIFLYNKIGIINLFHGRNKKRSQKYFNGSKQHMKSAYTIIKKLEAIK